MKDFCTVSNKSAGFVIYNIKEDGIRREFYPNETKEIAVKELQKLAQQPGGRTLLYDYLLINDAEIARYLITGEIALEYWIKPNEIPHWMETCSLPEFQDALDFAPEGTKDLIKKHAVSMPLNDYSKRQAIKDQLGFDVTTAIENGKQDEPKEEKRTARRVSASSAEEIPEAPKRRVVVAKN